MNKQELTNNETGKYTDALIATVVLFSLCISVAGLGSLVCANTLYDDSKVTYEKARKLNIETKRLQTNYKIAGGY